MTSIDRFERQLPAALADLADPHVPDYLTDILGRTVSTRQRPAWASLERWLPMVDLATRSTLFPRIPWRTIAVALLTVALLAVALVAVIGARQNRLPPPFGPARNGVVTYASNGDIFTVDPISGGATAIVTGPTIDAMPRFSRDGTKIAFLRRQDEQTTFDILVSAADGAGPRVVTTDPIDVADLVEWAPDGEHLLVATADGVLTKYDVVGTALPQVVAQGVRVVAGELRPPDGAQILYEPDSTPEIDLWIMDVDGSHPRLVLPAAALTGTRYDLELVRWSPDGRMIGFTCASPDAADVSHICVMDPDGTDVRQLTDESSDWFETDFVWSPDSQHIAFNRWRRGSDGTTVVQPIGVASINGGPVVATGPAPASEGALFDWSPDGTTLLSLPARFSGSADPNAAAAKPLAIDVASGSARELDWEVASAVSWQRRAP
ncbi:MAG TPA: hypothetical protein VM408_04760 [Methylomirabilota bacterium]|nr:hypothetical protein [Methylomirabilota bacterium]